MGSCKLLKNHVLDSLQVPTLILHEARHERDQSRLLWLSDGYFLNDISESLYKGVQFIVEKVFIVVKDLLDEFKCMDTTVQVVKEIFDVAKDNV